MEADTASIFCASACLPNQEVFPSRGVITREEAVCRHAVCRHVVSSRLQVGEEVPHWGGAMFGNGPELEIHAAVT